MKAESKTASDIRKPAGKESRHDFADRNLPEAFLKAHEGPMVACGELAMEVWDTGAQAGPRKK